MRRIISFIVLTLTLASCEDVVDVDLNEGQTRLVIDASINWLKGTSGNEQSIKLTLTAPFFNDSVPPANGATVVITDSNSNIYIFLEDGNTGIYITDNFIPIIDETYTLTIIYNGETYIGTETLKSVVPIDFVEQTDNGGFTGEDLELKAYYTDPAEEENYYLFEFVAPNEVAPILDVYEDSFTNGNQIFGYYSEDDLEAGDEVTISNIGVSQRFYDFMFILLQQGSDQGGPFETQPAIVRGNCINTTNADNYPFGYFRLSEVDQIIYTIE